MLVYLIIKTFPLPFPKGLFLPVRIILVTLLQWVGSFAMEKRKKKKENSDWVSTKPSRADLWALQSKIQDVSLLFHYKPKSLQSVTGRQKAASMASE